MSSFYTNIQMMGNHILYRGIEDGKRVKHKVPYKPSLFVRAKPGTATQYANLAGEHLEKIEFGSIYDAREFVKLHKDVEQYKIYGNTNYVYSYIADEFPGQVEFDMSKIIFGIIDIEVGSENGFPEVAQASEPITAITLLLNKNYFVFGLGDFVVPAGRTDIRYVKCATEKALIEMFVALWYKFKPDIISGWNCKYFDFPYLINRMYKLEMNDTVNKLSPWGKVKEREARINNNVQQYYDIVGVSMLDYIDLYKKYAPQPNQESYKLSDIAFVEVGESKLDYSEYQNLHTLYKRNHQLFIEYNIHDTYLVFKINEKIRLIELAMTLAYDNKVNFEDVFSQVRMWDSIINNHLRKKNIIIPPKETHLKSKEYSGGYVKDPILGLHKWGVSFDLDGLYPHLIMQYNLSPETLVHLIKVPKEIDDWYNDNLDLINVDGILSGELDTSILKKYNLCMTPNGAFFKRDKLGFLPELMNTMYEDRKKYKNQMIEYQKQREQETDQEKKFELDKLISKYNNFQNAKKVTLNSAYGAIGNEYFRFFDIRIAEAVTTSGQLSVRWIGNKMNSFLNKLLDTDQDYIIASDTDSIYLRLGAIVEKTMDESKVDKTKISLAMDQFCNTQIQPYINKSFKELADYMNAYANKMSMKREAIFDRAIWTAKKRYILNVYNNEGVQYKEPKLKIKGLEAVKSSTPNVVRGMMKRAFEIIVKDDPIELIDFVDDFREAFMAMPLEQISSPRGCNGLDEYIDKQDVKGITTPFHVKGALVYNQLLKEKKLTKKFESIKNGNKIKYMYLKKKNPVQSLVISFPASLPEELGLHQYIDYDKQFDKTFIEPLTVVLDAIGWTLEEENSVERFCT